MKGETQASAETDGLRILVIDNYDSFVYNLVQYVGELVSPPADGPDPISGSTGEVIVRRNDVLDLADVDAIDPDAIVVSPGPGTPAEAGIAIPLFADREYPTLGVCLGHQALCAAAGGEIGYADAVVHGKPSTITHDGRGIFDSMPNELTVGRYHSLAVDRANLPSVLTETAYTDDEAHVVMAVRHNEVPHVGVQFHPESILTSNGITLIANFLELYVIES